MTKVTLPRLELCAVVMLAVLIDKNLPVLKAEINSIYLRTESTIVLPWISSSAMRRNTFVAKRVACIQETTNVSVLTLGNLADLISQAVTQQEKLVNRQLWWQGLQWLQEMTEDVPGEHRMRSLVAPTCVLTTGYVKRFLSFAKLVRVTAYVQCICHNAHYPNKKKKRPF